MMRSGGAGRGGAETGLKRYTNAISTRDSGGGIIGNIKVIIYFNNNDTFHALACTQCDELDRGRCVSSLGGDERRLAMGRTK